MKILGEQERDPTHILNIILIYIYMQKKDLLACSRFSMLTLFFQLFFAIQLLLALPVE